MLWHWGLFVICLSSTQVAHSQCNSGYTGPVDGVCLPCQANTYMYKKQDDAFQKLLLRNMPYIVSDAADWNTATRRFDSRCGNMTCAGNTGGLEAGAVTTGIVEGNGAVAPVTFVGGNTATRMQWGAGSIPVQFTVCSVTRYSGASRSKILNSWNNPQSSILCMYM